MSSLSIPNNLREQTMNSTYEISPGLGMTIPILISCPHVGTDIPKDIKDTMESSVVEATEDTDWYVHELYSFAPQLGITLIKANYSRYVIDLNRDPSGKNLYQDTRRQTAMVPLTTFEGKSIYKDHKISEEEVERRRRLFFDPYYDAVADEIRKLKAHFPHILFFDAHSIKRHVKTIQNQPFPDVILGDNDGASAHPTLSQSALIHLKNAGLSVSHNVPFKGGFLT